MERTLLERFEAHIVSLGLLPPPALVGVIEPADTTELPALVLSIVDSTRLGNGLGERSVTVTRGALPWRAEVNLASPFLLGHPEFSLVSADRRRLTLPHGGLLRRDGASGALSSEDLQVTLDGEALALVQGAPGAGQFAVDPLVGALTFGSALPVEGELAADYTLGQWEQRVRRGQGVLELTVFAEDGSTARDLSDAVLSALDDSGPSAVPGLSQLTVSEIGRVGRAEPPLSDARRRSVRFRFEFEQVVNVPESSGGIIQRIPVQTVLGVKESNP